MPSGRSHAPRSGERWDGGPLRGRDDRRHGHLAAGPLRDSTAPFADAATEIFGGTFWGKVVALVVMVSTFGALNGWILPREGPVRRGQG